MGRLSNLFDEKLISARDLAAHKPQSINDLGSGSDDVGQAVISASTEAMRTSYRVDYSDYSNFVFFNSALDYFNTSGEKVINDFPRTGTFTDTWAFSSGCDDYQTWLVQQSWPAAVGYMSGCAGYTNDVYQKMDPGTGSFSIELMTFIDLSYGSSATLVEKMGPSGSGYSVYTDGSATIHFDVRYNSATAVQLSYSFGSPVRNLTSHMGYFSFVVDRDSNVARIMFAPEVRALEENAPVSGFLATYPSASTILASASLTSVPSVSTSGSYLTILSGTKGNTTGTLSLLSYWSKARSLADVSSSYAGNMYQQANLELLYRFDDAVPSGVGTIIRDYSGNGFDGFMSGVAVLTVTTGTHGTDGYYQSPMTMSHVPSPVTAFSQIGALSGVVESYVARCQLTASAYDKANTNIITRMVPEAYLQLEEELGTAVLERFLYLIARQFDQIKVAVDQFTNWNKSNYTGFNDTPDTLLNEAAQFYGWDFVGNFLNHDAIRYFFGKNVVPGADIELKLYQIKNEFWRRTLNELMHIYKTKGTRESVEALLRVYGLDDKIVKLKEYGVKPHGRIETRRINAHKSVPVMRFQSGSRFQVFATSSITGVDGYSVSANVRFGSQGLDTVTTATFMRLGDNVRMSAVSGSTTGTLIFGDITASAPIIDGRWWNIFVTAAPSSSTVPGWSGRKIVLQRLDEDTVASRVIFTGSSTSFFSPVSGTTFGVGNASPSKFDIDFSEVKLFGNYQLTQDEMDAQTLDFQSYGVNDFGTLTQSLTVHWKFDEAYTIYSGTGAGNGPSYHDHSGNGHTGYFSISSSVTSTIHLFDRFMFDYNFIAPVEYGWNEEKIRVYDGSSIAPGDHFNEANALALEFNLIDALNEDMSKMFATLDNWNNVIGIPANKFRDSYSDLQKYRTYYFNKLSGRVNFRQFADLLEFFDRSFVKMVQKLLPARAIFYGEEFVIESHMLERPKVQWAYRRYSPELVPEGIITMVDHSGSFNGQVSTTRYFG